MGSVSSTFRKSALASGLLSQQHLDEALLALRQAGQAMPSDEQLAAQAVALGRINSWQASQLLAGRTKFNLGPYQVVDSIGQGGMGQVFKAEHSIMGRLVAVKVLPRSRSTPNSIANFSREIRAQAMLDHEHLVRAYDAGHDGNVYFLVTEYVPGCDLRKLVRRDGPLPMSRAASIICQAAAGLEHAHRRGLIHRDVKPGNVLVTPEGKAKVSDLGLAGYSRGEGDDEEAEVDDDPHAGKVVGTSDYLSPEHIKTPDKVGPTSDVYSLGCTLYYAVTGKVPFPGGTTKDKARAHCQIQPLDPRRLNPNLSEEFVAVIFQMMAKEPTQRIGSAAEVIARLAAWAPREAKKLLGDAGVPPPPPMPVQRAAAAGAGGWRPGGGVGPPVSSPDTETNFLVQPFADPGVWESPSQVSQMTHPIAAGSEETIPLSEFDEESHLRRWRPTISLRVALWLLITLGAATAVITIGAIVSRLL